MGGDHFVIELDRPASDLAQLQELSGRARTAAERMHAEGASIRFIRSVFLPDEGVCFLLYRALDPNVALEAARRAEVGVGPIRQTIRVDEEVPT